MRLCTIQSLLDVWLSVPELLETAVPELVAAEWRREVVVELAAALVAPLVGVEEEVEGVEVVAVDVVVEGKLSFVKRLCF